MMTDLINNLTHWHWWIIGLVLLALELVIPAFFFLWLGVAAMVTGLVLMISTDMSWQGQIFLFSVLSVSSILISRKYYANRQVVSETPNLNRRAEQYVGRIFTLTEAIENGRGKISVDDSQWQVKGNKLPIGTDVRVIGVEGSIFLIEEVTK